MPTDTSVNNLVINKLTKAQYDGIVTKSETELYLVPDEIDTVPTSGSSNPITSGSVYTALQNKQDTILDLSDIRNGAALGATALQSFTETDPTVPSWAKASSKPSYTANEVEALSNSTKYGASLNLSINNTTYVVTAQLKDQDGNNLGTAQTIDLPLESVVVSGTYDDTTKKVILTLKDDSTVDFSIADLVSGLQTEITSNNKLSADLIIDGTTNKVINVQSDWNVTDSSLDSYIQNKPTNVSSFTNDAGYLTSHQSLTNYVTLSTAQNISGRKTFLGEKAIYFKQSAASNKLGFTLYNNGGTEIGAFEYNPTGFNNTPLLNINTRSTNTVNVGFRYHSGTVTNIVAPRAGGDYYIPVSINNKSASNTGVITLSASDVGALPSSTSIPDDSTLVHKDSGNGIVETGLSVHEIDIYRAKIRDNNGAASEVLGTLLINNDDGSGEILLEDEDQDGFVQIKRKNGNSIETLQQALDARNNVQADWNQTTTTAADYIKNKPTIPTVPTNVSTFTNDVGYLTSYTETDPTVPNWAKVFPIITGDSASNVNNLQFLAPFKGTMGTGSGDAGRFKIGLYTTDGNTSLPADNTLITNIASQNDPDQAWGHATDDTIPTIGLVYNKVSEKADKVLNATNGHLAGLDSNGNLTDTGRTAVNLVEFSSDNGVGIVPEDGIKAETVTSAATMSINPDVVTIIDGAVGTSVITFQVPNDNLAHVWDIFMTTDSVINITFSMSVSGATIKMPTDLVQIAVSKSIEVSVVGTGLTYYLRYGEFT